MHRLESLLVAIELKDRLLASFPEAAEVTADRVRFHFRITVCFLKFRMLLVQNILLVIAANKFIIIDSKLGQILEALTTERCSEHFSLERLEVLGDAFLKFAVARYLFLKHGALDEGQLTKKRSNIVNNANLLKLATRNTLQVTGLNYGTELLKILSYDV